MQQIHYLCITAKGFLGTGEDSSFFAYVNIARTCLSMVSARGRILDTCSNILMFFPV